MDYLKYSQNTPTDVHSLKWPSQNEIDRAVAGINSENRHANGRKHVFGVFEATLKPVDRRTKVASPGSPPWNKICSLTILGKNGRVSVGTGWMVGPKTIITAGHCVYSKTFFEGWAAVIKIAPGRNGELEPLTQLTSVRFSALEQWTNDENPDFDIGCIHLDEAFAAGSEFFDFESPDPNLIGRTVNVAGYPTDRELGRAQFEHRGEVLYVKGGRAFYDVDTHHGQSGAPLWLEYPNGMPKVIGVHAYARHHANPVADTNSGPLFSPAALETLERWLQED